jgi:uncharacterized membrane protein
MKRNLCIVITLILTALVIIAGAVLGDKYYAAVTVIIALLSCVPFLVSFDGNSSRRVVILAVMTALTVAGRFVFAPIPFFKPVTAMVVISAMYFGSELGFLTGALSAVISNFYFGQGPWTPFQMFSWGIIGLVAGILSDPLNRSRIILCIYAVLSGIAYSMIMDVWTTLWADNSFNPERFIASVTASAPITLIYAVSNVIFLLILTPLFGKKIQRIIDKYGKM